MTVKGKIAEYRERLDKTLASRDLTDEETLKTLVKDHMLRSTDHRVQEPTEYVIDKRTSDLSTCLGMLRTSESNEETPQKTSHAAWKLKQDTEEYRVMYREGPEGSPLHTLLVEGYVDAPVDACLCISVEAALYTIWFPEIKVPTFKIILAQCLRRIRIGENISLVRFVQVTALKKFNKFLISSESSVCLMLPFRNSLEGRMKLSWPLSNREALVHFFEFEYLQDGLVIVMMNTPDVESIRKEIHDFSDDHVPEAGQTVRVDIVGAFALQKVTEERSYFRTIANMDVKLDFVPPWLINFVSRQLIGTGFKLYKKILTSKSKEDGDIVKALNDPLYIRIRKVLYPSTELKRNANMITGHVDEQVPANGHFSQSSPEYTVSSDWKPSNEIEEEEIQEIKNPESTDKGSTASPVYYPKANHASENYAVRKNVRLSPQVQKALGTLDKAIFAVREARTKSQSVSPARFSLEGSPKVEFTEAKLASMEDYNGIHLDDTTPLTPPKAETTDRSIRSLRLNRNSLAPASPELILSSSNTSPRATPDVIETRRIGTPNSNITVNGKHEDNDTTQRKKTGQHKKWRMCCLHLGSRRLIS